MRNFKTSVFTIVMMLGPSALLIMLLGAAASAASGDVPAATRPDKQAIESAMQLRFGFPVKVTKIRSVPNDSPTPNVTDYKVNMTIGDKHRAQCSLRVLAEKEVALMNHCSSKTATVEADSLMSFSELEMQRTVAN